jgi:hypothetical protein
MMIMTRRGVNESVFGKSRMILRHLIGSRVVKLKEEEKIEGLGYSHERMDVQM